MSEGYVYIDKTSLIIDILSQGKDIALFIRPRRFGKTLNLQMLRCFFEKTEPGKGELFENLEIANHQKENLEFMF